jgi:hypothetical protein
MRKLLIEADCEEKYCRNCRLLFHGQCMLSAWWHYILDEWIGPELEYDTSAIDYIRLPECLEAERKAEGEITMLYRKRPVVIQAMQLRPDTFDECVKFIGEANLGDGTSEEECFMDILTPEGTMSARNGDWIIQGVNGKFYPCKPDIFDKTYERVEEADDGET